MWSAHFDGWIIYFQKNNPSRLHFSDLVRYYRDSFVLILKFLLIEMEFEGRYRQAQRPKYECLLFGMYSAQKFSSETY